MQTKKIETMTVGELKKYLEEFPDNAPVVFSFPARDYWRSTLLSPIHSAVYGNAKYSEYHQQLQLETDEEKAENLPEVLILGA
jgi:hypothetical protein